VSVIVHEVLVATFFGHDRRPRDGLDGAIDLFARAIEDGDAVLGEDPCVAVVEEHESACVIQDGGDVGREKSLALAETDDEG